MGTAKQKPELVSVVVCANAHVDEANTSEGFVSKHTPLRVEASIAAALVERHPYLTISTGQGQG